MCSKEGNQCWNCINCAKCSKFGEKPQDCNDFVEIEYLSRRKLAEVIGCTEYELRTMAHCQNKEQLQEYSERMQVKMPTKLIVFDGVGYFEFARMLLDEELEGVC